MYLVLQLGGENLEEGKNIISADLDPFSDGLGPFIYCILTYALSIINIDQKQQTQ